MGNTQANETRSLCDFEFFTPADLRKSSLQKEYIRRPKAKSNTCVEHKRQPSASSQSSVEVQKEVNTPDTFQRNPLSKRAHTCIILKEKEKSHVNENDFRIMQIIADGKYGRICMVKRDDQNEKYAMKIYGKRKISHQCWTENAMIEKEILEKSNHPFIPELVYSFENNKKIFLVTKFYEGGQLDQILKQLNRLSEEITKFYSAEVLLALEYLHEHVGVMYNDLKAENILLDSEGHIKLIDFDMAQKLSCLKSLPGSRTMLDSPPPEVINGTLTGRMVDYWGFGCFIYELLTGQKPFHQGHDEPQEVDKNVLENKLEWPQFISKTAKDLITRLLDPKVEERLGYNGIAEIKAHPFFSNVKWDKIISKTVYPPLNPAQYKEHTSMPEEEDDDEDQLSESEDMDHCSLTYIPESGTTKAETCLLSAGLPYRKNLVNTSEGSYDGLARSS